MQKVSVPADPHTVLYPVNTYEESNYNVPYREAVESLMFLAIISRPDIAFAVNNVSKFLNNHNASHWQAVKRIFAYLINNIDLGIEYHGNDNEFEFSDADYANDIETRRSTSGYVFSIAHGLVTWSSQRQKLVSMSTAESEYIAAASAAKEAVWLRNLLDDIGYRCGKPTILYVDNQSTIRLIKNSEFHKRTKHIDIRHHFIREKVEQGDIEVKYVPTNYQRADILTKHFPESIFVRCVRVLK